MTTDETRYQQVAKWAKRMNRPATITLFVTVIFALVMIIAVSSRIMLHGHGNTAENRNLVLLVVSLVGFIFALVSMGFSYFQYEAMITQIVQAEAIAERKDEALIAAIEALTEELKRRPVANYSATFSLFGGRQ